MPNPFYVSTKSMVNDEPTADDLRRRVEQSLRRMNVEKINFMHMWCILNLEDYNRVIAPGGPYEGALKLKDEGLIEHIVFSTHAKGDEIELMVNSGRFEGVLLGYNATNFAFRRKGIKAAYEKGLGVVTMNPLGGGIIPQNPDFYSFIRDNDEDTLAQAALKFNASHKEISVVLSGMSSIEEVDENVQAGEDYGVMSDERMDQITAHLNRNLDQLCTGCGYCDNCPQDIPIPKYMDAYNMYILKNESDAIVERLKWHWGLKAKDAAACIACGVCERECTQHLPIINRLKMIADL